MAALFIDTAAALAAFEVVAAMVAVTAWGVGCDTNWGKEVTCELHLTQNCGIGSGGQGLHVGRGGPCKRFGKEDAIIATEVPGLHFDL